MKLKKRMLGLTPMIVAGFLIVALLMRFHDHRTWIASIAFGAVWMVLMALSSYVGIRIGRSSRREQQP